MELPTCKGGPEGAYFQGEKKRGEKGTSSYLNLFLCGLIEREETGEKEKGRTYMQERPGGAYCMGGVKGRKGTSSYLNLPPCGRVKKERENLKWGRRGKPTCKEDHGELILGEEKKRGKVHWFLFKPFPILILLKGMKSIKRENRVTYVIKGGKKKGGKGANS